MISLRLSLILFSICAAAMMPSSRALADCEPARAATKFPESAKRIIKIGTPTTTPPFAYSDPANLERVTGIEVEMIEFTMQCAGLKFEYVKGPFSSLIQSVMSGSTDVMIGNVNYRTERAEKVDYVIYLRSGQSVIVPRGNPRSLKSLEDICGASASSTVGGTSNTEVERQSAGCVSRGKPPINFIPAVDQEAAVRQLVNRRIDFVMDGSVTAKMRALAQKDELELAFSIATDLVLGPVVKKGNDELRQMLLEGMQTMERNGKLKELLAKYELSEFAQPIELRR